MPRMTTIDIGRGCVVLIVAGALLVLAGCPASAPDGGVAPGTQAFGLQAAGRDRTYILHAPGSYRFGVPMPVVMAFHPIAGGGRPFLEDNDWDDQAERDGFIVVAPDGLGLDPDRPIGLDNFSGWSAVQVSFGDPTANYDVLFFDALLADLSLRLGFPVERVFLAGHSEGGSLGFVLATERPANVRAFAAVASHWIGIGPAPEPPPPTLFIVGTADPLAPLTDAGGVASIQFTFDRWALALGCGLAPLPVSDVNGVRTVEYAGCRAGTAYRVVFVADQGHRWPGGHGLLNDVLGPDANRLNATTTIAAFFRQH